MIHGPNAALERIKRAEHLWLFLDYDGTLAEFAPTPDSILTDPALIELIQRLAARPDTRVAVVSGRRLAHIKALLPVQGILLAGTYGLEIRLPDGKYIQRLDFARVRPALETLKPVWAALLDGNPAYYLEDKGWSLAIHARFAEDHEAETKLATAEQLAAATLEQSDLRLLGGHKFLEISPTLADKGQTIDYLLERDPWPQALPVYLGDDDKDEQAMARVNAHGGLAVLVASEARPTQAVLRLESPNAARQWLHSLLD